MKLLWLDLNSSYAHSSLALPALHAQIANNTDIEWCMVSATINENTGSVVNQIYRHQPDIIAATNWLFNHEQLLHIVSRAKALLPHCCVILGGPEFLGDNEAFLYKNKFVSGVFRGEGEEVFPLWLKVWNQPRKEWKSITGLCYLNESGEYQDNGLARVMNFSELVPPEKSCFFNWSKPFVQLETTRGCFNTCAFCVSGGEKPVRTLSLEAIKERLDVIHEHGIKNVRVLDRTFNYNNKRAKDLLNLFCEYPDICFHLEIHPALLSDELKQELATLPKGLLHLEAGIQSLRKNVLEQSRRIGKLSDALAGLHYLCSLENMETHADLIAGLPLYHLSEIFDDVRTLTEYGAGEIQLESLKLLPGTEMRRRADELGIQYSPLPPYEVLQTREITVDELQTAHYLSRLLDGFYNTPTWRNITRILILENPHFIHDLLDHLVRTDIIDTPLSLERRGLILYDFCKNHYPDYLTQVSIAWIEAGMSLKKAPAEKVRTKRQLPPESWEVVYGAYRENLRLCFLPVDEEGHGYWFGFESEIQKIQPVFKARKLS
ncbi:B12-binding domain-containing radical SAM protein [Bacteroides xylanisolvens]|uniref:B12-binding domain-containing radical SAM protein n=1 Tax=Bacteroides xylanisolvens TaxID=371601 RepID=UPI00374E8974